MLEIDVLLCVCVLELSKALRVYLVLYHTILHLVFLLP